jgi:ERCC4-type nuclease
MFIIVDKNEEVNSPHVVERLRRFFPALECETLDCGDIKIILEGGNVLAIERKRAGDFLGSIGDGRLFNQVERMSKSSKWCCVIIEGQISYDKDDMAVIPVYDRSGNMISAEVTGWHGASSVVWMSNHFH